MTKIEWATESINPWVGCSKVSPACDHCYAERMAKRLKAIGLAAYQKVVDQNGWTGKIESQFVQAKRKLDKVPRDSFIFWCSMSDFFHPEIMNSYRDCVLEWMLKRTDVTHLLLTKRQDLARKYICGLTEHYRCHEVKNSFQTRQGQHIWQGVTAENQARANCRIIELMKTPLTGKRFVSLEPLLDMIDLTRININGLAAASILEPLDWVIVGAETGPGHRPCKLEWIDSIITQCHAADVPVFVKAVHDDHGRPIKDLDKISKMLGRPAESIRQWPTTGDIHELSTKNYPQPGQFEAGGPADLGPRASTILDRRCPARPGLGGKIKNRCKIDVVWTNKCRT